MIDRFILCSNYIASILINIHRGPEMLTADEIDIAKEMFIYLFIYLRTIVQFQIYLQ